MAPLALGVAAPEQVDDPLFAFGDGADDGIGEGLPAAAGVRGGLVGPHGQHGVQQQDPLLGPAVEVPAGGYRSVQVAGDLLEDVLQRGRERDAVRHREAEAVGLALPVVGVLTDDDDLQLVERTLVESPEDVARARKDPSGGVLLPDEIGQFPEIGLVEFGLQNLFPVLRYLDIHDRSVLGG